MVRAHQANQCVHEQCLRVERRPFEIREEAEGKIAAAFLEAFTFKATPSAKPIIDALDVLKALYRTGQRSLPAKAPIRFIRRVWRSLVIQGGEIDRKAYELCV